MVNNMDDYTKITHKHYSNISAKDSNKKIKYLKGLITRVLLSVILFICICIITKVNNENILFVEKYIFEDSLKFTTFNNWYKDHFGSLIPSIKDNDELVFGNDDLKDEYEKYLDGVKINTSKNSPISALNGGIVVFIGDKENYGKTVIIQGNDGINYWYGNVDNISINLYDYIEKNTLIGEAADDYIYLVLQDSDSFLDYDEYIKKV